MKVLMTASMIALVAGATAAGAANVKVSQQEQQMLNNMSPEMRQEVQSRLTDKRRVKDVVETMYLNDVASEYQSVRNFEMRPDGYYMVVREQETGPWHEMRIDPKTGEQTMGDVVNSDDVRLKTIDEGTTAESLPESTVGMDKSGGPTPRTQSTEERANSEDKTFDGTQPGEPGLDRSAANPTPDEKTIEQKTADPDTTAEGMPAEEQEQKRRMSN